MLLQFLIQFNFSLQKPAIKNEKCLKTTTLLNTAPATEYANNLSEDVTPAIIDKNLQHEGENASVSGIFRQLCSSGRLYEAWRFAFDLDHEDLFELTNEYRTEVRIAASISVLLAAFIISLISMMIKNYL